MTSVGANAGIRPPVLEVEGVVKRYGALTAVDGVDLVIQPGEAIALLGPNGAGKTTLVEMIEGLTAPTAGVLRLDGRTWREGGPALYRKLGIALQETRFQERLTVAETLALFGALVDVGADRQRETLGFCGLAEKAKARVGGLSGGQRQKLALAIAVLHGPELLILDEPTTGLDPAARRELWDLLRDLRRRFHTSLLLTTHYMEEAEVLCDRIVVLDRGRVLAEGTLAELLQQRGLPETLRFHVRGGGPFAVPEDGGAWTYDEATGLGGAQVPSAAESVVRLVARAGREGRVLEEISSRKATLEDLFLSLTGRRLQDEPAPEDSSALRA